MARIKSLLTATMIDKAQRSHNCQRDAGHRIAMGENRFNVRPDNGRGWDRYCLACARTIVARDLVTLQNLSADLQKL